MVRDFELVGIIARRRTLTPLGMDQILGSISGEPRGTTLMDQNLNLEQTPLFFAVSLTATLIQIQKSNLLISMSAHYSDR